MLSSLPSGVPVPPGSTPLDVITNAIVALGPDKQIELLQQMKVCAVSFSQIYSSDLRLASQSFVTSSPDAARAVLVSHPQLAYACFQTMLMTNVVDPAVLQVSSTSRITQTGTLTHLPVNRKCSQVVPPSPHPRQRQYPLQSHKRLPSHHR